MLLPPTAQHQIQKARPGGSFRDRRRESEATLGQCGSEGRPIGHSFLPILHTSLGCGALGEQVRGTATLTTKPEEEEAFNASHFQIRCGCSDAMTA